MARILGTRQGWWFALAVTVALLPAVAVAGQKKLKAGEYNPADPTVDMFAAMKAGDIDVKFIPKDSTQARVLIKNKTKKPLNIKLPEVFAGVPVLAQAGGGPMAGGGGGRQGGGGGGGMQGMGGGMMGGMGMMNVKPETVGNVKVTTVCLEHGKKEPRPQAPYEIKPIEQFTKNTEIRELCALLGQGKLDQRAAQAATWHFSNNMSWQELAAKHYRHANGTTSPYFSQNELKVAVEIASTVTRLVKEREQSMAKKAADKSGKEDSLSEKK